MGVSYMYSGRAYIPTSNQSTSGQTSRPSFLTTMVSHQNEESSMICVA